MIGSTDTAVSGTAVLLKPNTTYYYRAVVSGAGGTSAGATFSLTTLIEQPPAVTTMAATSVSSTRATLNGTANANGETTNVSFQYSTSSTFAPTVQTTVGSGLHFPQGVAVDAAGDVILSVGNSIKASVAGTGAITTVASGLISPTSIALDDLGDVFVIEFGSSAIKEIMAGTRAITTIGSGFSFPNGVAVDSAGDVFVSDWGNDAVKEVMAGTGQIVTIGSGSTIYGLGDIAVDAAGDVFVEALISGVIELASPRITAAPTTARGSTNTTVSGTLSGLTPNTTYYYRAVASGPSGIVVGSTRTFTTNA